MQLSFVLLGILLPVDGIGVFQTIASSAAKLEDVQDLKYMKLDFSAIRKDLDKSMACLCQN